MDPVERPVAPPTVSVIVASATGDGSLPRCLDSLRAQTASPLEVLVVDRCGGEVAERVCRDHAFATLIDARCSPQPSVQALRARGIEQARGDVVAVLQEHCIAPAHWVETIRDTFESEDAAIGGPVVGAGYERLRDWVIYLSEYHAYLPPWGEGDRIALASSNIAYHREKVLRHRELLSEGYWELGLHPTLAGEGRFRAVPLMGVLKSGPFGYGHYLSQRYLLSRVWGGVQRHQVDSHRRLLYLLVAPAFPALFLTRMAIHVMRSDLPFNRFLRSLPLLLPVAAAYIWGEWLGYLVGPGDATERVE